MPFWNIFFQGLVQTSQKIPWILQNHNYEDDFLFAAFKWKKN